MRFLVCSRSVGPSLHKCHVAGMNNSGSKNIYGAGMDVGIGFKIWTATKIMDNHDHIPAQVPKCWEGSASADFDVVDITI